MYFESKYQYECQVDGKIFAMQTNEKVSIDIVKNIFSKKINCSISNMKLYLINEFNSTKLLVEEYNEDELSFSRIMKKVEEEELLFTKEKKENFQPITPIEKLDLMIKEWLYWKKYGTFPKKENNK